ncbi:Hemolysin, contains CBS domains [Thermoactinomyces sp. DSM 45891]|uniref:hemolysin family protein n=1 Tax=Thermoactinomyces sp. DSM 45891 TaxID=1761907 RepID=UPI000921A449|nr:hemolysin family protein [Thermoactinomyces sp. DSM 45891]SFX60353.1 Hemolysin, contains CBS domains [Thermoactinomyces sp. DSM 45891]
MEGVISNSLYLLFALFLVFLNGFFVAAEFAIVKVRSTRIAQVGHRRGRLAQKVLANLDAYLSATQLGITLASLGLGWVAEPAIARLLKPMLVLFQTPEWLIHTISVAIGFLIVTFLHIVVGEMAPKTLAIRQAEKVTLWIAPPLHLFYSIFRPFIFVLNGSANWLLRACGIEMNDHHSAHTEEEIRLVLQQSHKSGYIDKTEMQLFDNVFDFTERIAREVMISRTQMTCIYSEDDFATNLDIIVNSTHTRFPICEQDKDQIIGIIHIRDVFEALAKGKQPTLKDLSRPVSFVPETMEIKDVMFTLQKNRVGMAIVVDEFGGTSGIITLEDIMEEIFGEIQDEFDQELPLFRSTGSHTSIDARLLLEDVNRHFKLKLVDEDNDTIGGWLFSQLQAIPNTGDSYDAFGYTFEVEAIENRRISRIMVKKSPADT